MKMHHTELNSSFKEGCILDLSVNYNPFEECRTSTKKHFQLNYYKLDTLNRILYFLARLTFDTKCFSKEWRTEQAFCCSCFLCAYVTLVLVFRLNPWNLISLAKGWEFYGGSTLANQSVTHANVGSRYDSAVWGADNKMWIFGKFTFCLRF